jgi:N-acyl-D-amino-acid deacylase
MPTTLIKNGLLYDGTGNSPHKADVLISRGVIEGVGAYPLSSAVRSIDASGLVITPGFIETALRPDDYCAIFSASHTSALQKRGITTVIAGGFGESLVPFSSSLVNRGLHDRCDVHANRDWETPAELFKYISVPGRSGINFGSFTGFETLRHAVVSRDASDLTDGELAVLIKLLRRNLQEGMLGLSVDLGTPRGALISKRALLAVASALKDAGGSLSITLRAEADFETSFRELTTLAKKTGVALTISNFPEPYRPGDEELAASIASLEKKSSEMNVHFDVSPWEDREGLLREFLPRWAIRKNRTEMMNDLALPLHKKRVLEYLRGILPKDLMFMNMPQPLSFLNGKTLKETAKNQGKRVAETYLRILMTSLGEGEFRLSGAYEPRESRSLLSSPLSILASGSILFSETVKESPVFSLAEKAEIPLERLVEKYSLAPAKKYGLLRRGVVKPGYAADLAVFGERGEVRELFVNGVRAIADGIETGAGGGRGMLNSV